MSVIKSWQDGISGEIGDRASCEVRDLLELGRQELNIMGCRRLNGMSRTSWAFPSLDWIIRMLIRSLMFRNCRDYVARQGLQNSVTLEATPAFKPLYLGVYNRMQLHEWPAVQQFFQTLCSCHRRRRLQGRLSN